MAQTGDGPATAIFDIAHQCLASFDRIVETGQDGPLLTRRFGLGNGTGRSGGKPQSCDFLGLRYSFLYWVDYTGALSLIDSSLDARLRGLAEISSMVIELLEMVLRNLRRLDGKPGDPPISSLGSKPPEPVPDGAQALVLRWEDALRAIDSALDRLNFLAAAIRKASAKQLEYNVTTFLTEEDIVFRRDISALTRWRFPAARRSLSSQLGNSIAIRRRILLNKHRHAKKLAIRRPAVEAAPPTKKIQDVGPDPKRAEYHPAREDRPARYIDVPASSVTKASKPDTRSPALRNLHLPKRPALTSVVSAVSAAPEDSFEYPPPPDTKGGETRIQCPYCLIPLDLRELGRKGDEYWRRHVDEDLKPYVCLFPECAKSMVFFTRRVEWKAHMECTHSRDWPRKVHAITWYCDLDHDPPEQFETEIQWRSHMTNLDSHPKRQLAEPTKDQLDAMSPRKQQVALREYLVCPLCEQIPEKLRPLAGGVSLVLGDSFGRLVNEGSVPQPPSGVEHIDGASLPPEAWSILYREDIPALESAWDKEYSGYVRPDDPPDLLDDGWIETWKTWKEKSDPPTHEHVDSDPIMAHIRISKSRKLYHAAKNGDTAVVRQLLEDGVHVDSKDEYGMTPLLGASRGGYLDTVELLLENGADIESKYSGYENFTPLTCAAEEGHDRVVSLLLQYGADIDPQNDAYSSPLDCASPLLSAVYKGHEDTVMLLLESGADIEPKSVRDRGSTLLIQAARWGNDGVVRALVEKGAAIESVDKFGETALLSATTARDAGTIWFLLEKGADIEAKDAHGQTSLSRAAKLGFEPCARIFIEKGADIESKDSEFGQTPLSWAAREGKEIIVRLLLDNGADINSKDSKFGRTPLSWASQNGHNAVERLLAERGGS
ncbi:uncharacterized protein DNG_01670 [Cephalotrichum gorgonifer]|uniref:Uncharacterized protein n=1 Tax=Cephalotrichum gorgonifer TaxID=2041049 RepID=A0AAE8MS89_9PEZI|nr:uncharacterized protein DNG_01670 [Cephalotrichum gorgonifer]